jgi:DNA-binding transcriptional MocR family regulator
MIRGLIESGSLQKNVDKLVRVYGARCHAMDAAIRKHLPDVEYSTPQGGFFFWLRLREGIEAAELRRNARTFKVDFRPGTLSSSRGGLKDYMRLCCVYYDEEQIEEGILRLKQSLESDPPL